MGDTVYIVGKPCFIKWVSVLYCGYTGYVVGTSDILWETLYPVGNVYLVGTPFMSWVRYISRG